MNYFEQTILWTIPVLLREASFLDLELVKLPLFYFGYLWSVPSLFAKLLCIPVDIEIVDDLWTFSEVPFLWSLQVALEYSITLSQP